MRVIVFAGYVVADLAQCDSTSGLDHASDGDFDERPNSRPVRVAA